MGKRYDELEQAVTARDVGVLRGRVLPEALVAQGRTNLPLVALRAGFVEGAEVLLEGWAAANKRDAPSTHLAMAVRFAVAALDTRTTTIDEATELLAAAHAAGMMAASDGQDELLCTFKQPALFEVVQKLVPPRDEDQKRDLAWAAITAFSTPGTDAVLSLLLKSIADIDAAVPGKLPLLFLTVQLRLPRHAKILMKRGSDAHRPGPSLPEGARPFLHYEAGMSALAYAQAWVDATTTSPASWRKAPIEVLRALGGAPGIVTVVDTASRKIVKDALRALGKKLKVSKTAIEDALATATPGKGVLADRFPDVAFVVAAAAAIGTLVRDDGEADFEASDLFGAILSAEPFGSPGEPTGDATLLARSERVASANGAWLLATREADEVVMYRIDDLGEANPRESIGAWLASELATTRLV